MSKQVLYSKFEECLNNGEVNIVTNINDVKLLGSKLIINYNLSTLVNGSQSIFDTVLKYELELPNDGVERLICEYKRSEIQYEMGLNHQDREQNKGIMMGIVYTLKMLDRYDILDELGVKYD